MAFVEKRGAKKYRARYRGPDGRERSRTFERKVDAEKWIAEQTVEKDRGTWVDPRGGRRLFGEWTAERVALRDLREASKVRDETYLRRHVLPRFGEYRLRDIDRQSVQAWVLELSKSGLAPATVHACHRLLSGVLAEAVDERLIAESPCRKIKLPRITKPKHRFLNAQEVGRLADAIGPYYAPLIYTAAYLGCRWGELAGLKRENLNLLRRQVQIVGTLEDVRGHLRYVEDTKSESSRRLLTMPGFLVDVLAQHLATAPPSEYVFVGRDGAPLRRSAFRARHFKPALEQAELDPGIRFHDLRHTCAALLIEQGAHVKEIQERLGHSSITTTMNVYGHLMPGLGARLDDALDEAYRATNADNSRPGRGLAAIGESAG